MKPRPMKASIAATPNASTTAPALPHPSLHALHRRGWGRTYAALAAGEVDAEAFRTALAARPLAGGSPIYAGDAGARPCCDAEAGPGRGSYRPSGHSAGQPNSMRSPFL